MLSYFKSFLFWNAWFAFFAAIFILVKFYENYQPLNELKTRYLLTNERIKELREENNRLSWINWNKLIQLFVFYGVPQLTDEESTHPSLDYENSIRNVE